MVATLKLLLPRVFITLLIAAVFGLFFLPVQVAQAATFSPGCTGTVGDAAQLEADIVTANGNSQNDTINLVAGCTYTLTATLAITNDASAATDITLNGNGATISGNNAVRVMSIAASTVVALNNVTISNGNVTGGGGGISNSGTLTLTDSTISGNTATLDGGGISSSSTATLIISNSTISGNTARGNGGGINPVNTRTVYLSFVTITGNTADFDNDGLGSGGGVNRSGGGTTTIRNSIITGNSDTGGSFGDCFGITWQGTNLVGDTAAARGCTGASNTIAGASSTVIDTTLASNGGLTQTHLLAAGSPALNVIIPANCTTVVAAVSVTTDQRSAPRPQATNCDAGAVEGSAADTVQTGTTLVVNTSNDIDDSLCGALHCSLREAIIASNASTTVDNIIEFNIPGSGTHTITPASVLPTISDTVTINGESQSGGSGAVCTSGARLIEIAVPTGTSGFGLNLNTGSNGSTIRGLAISGYNGSNSAGLAAFTPNHIIECNFIGTNAAGTAQANGGNSTGIWLTGSNTGTRVGTDGNGSNDANERNVISGNSTAVLIYTSNQRVSGNYIGVNVTNSANILNNAGVVFGFGATNNIIGFDGTGTPGDEGNIIRYSSNGIRSEDDDDAGNRFSANSIAGGSAATFTIGIELWPESGAAGATAMTRTSARTTYKTSR